MCECTKLDCTELLPLTMAAYEAVRANPTHFIVAPDPSHFIADVERIVERAEALLGARKDRCRCRTSRRARRHDLSAAAKLKPTPSRSSPIPSRAAAAGSLARRGEKALTCRRPRREECLVRERAGMSPTISVAKETRSDPSLT